MSVSSKIIVYQPGMEPQVYDLDLFADMPESNRDRTDGEDFPTVRLGRGAVHGAGGSPPNNIVIDNCSFISRAQCSFLKIDGEWYVRDDNSKNGMLFEDKQVKMRQLHDGDRFYVGTDPDNRMVIVFSSRVKENPVPIERYSLKDSGQTLIGRSRDCDIVLKHPMVSRRHCVITRENGSYYIADNQSLHGVILNGKLLVGKVRLNPMDRISIADTTLFFDDGYLYFNEPKGGVSLVVRNLSKEVGNKGSKKLITNNVTLSILPNEFVAIIGGSGAGKTTLLDCISGMTGFTSGEVLVNGESIRTAGKNIRSLMGYVPQQDIVYDNLTLERMLYYSARLRMPDDTTQEEIRKKIDETLEIVELSEHRKTMISKLSGGQRKRASIAVELLASPKLFFLDEPSSGLDPGTERHLMQMLRRLSDSGKTVIMVTHTVQNIDLCDRLICMGKGGLLCYSGSPGEARKFFGKENITDIYDDLNDHAEEAARRWEARSNVFIKDEKPGGALKAENNNGIKKLLKQFTVITLRYAEIMKNSLPRLLLLLGMPVLLTLLVCLAFQADGGLYRKLGLSFSRDSFPFLVAPDTLSLIVSYSCAAFWIGIFNSIQEISKERPIYEREKFTGVAVFPYVMSKFVVLSVLCLVQSLIMTAFLFALGRNLGDFDASDMIYSMTTEGVIFSGNMFYLELFLTTFFCVISAMCLGLLISSMVSNDMALVLCPLCLLPQILFSGVVAKLSGITKIISRIISCRWATIGFATSLDVNSMYTSYYNSNSTEGWVAGPEYYDEIYGRTNTISYILNQDPLKSSWIILCLLSLTCVVVAVIVLFLRKRKTR